MTSLYQEKYRATKSRLRIRNIDYCINTWGDDNREPLFLLHGWADAGLSFQFLVDELAGKWRCIAPDWRGFGDSGRAECYWFPDYLLDLDLIIRRFAGEATVRIAGHSMGGNIAWLYGGICPDRVSHLLSIDAFGLPDASPADAPGRYARWMLEMQEEQQTRLFPDRDALAQYIRELAPGISSQRADFMTRIWGREQADGSVRSMIDPAHKRINPVLYRREEARACWRNIRARTGLVLAGKSTLHERYYREGAREDCLACIQQLEEFAIGDSGHLVHLVQPAALAAIMDGFFD